jgi:hypothetical protein
VQPLVCSFEVHEPGLPAEVRASDALPEVGKTRSEV